MKKEASPIPVMVAVLNQGKVATHTSEFTNRIIAEAFIGKQYEPTVVYSCVNGVEYNRHEIVQKFLKTNCKYLLMVDEDNPCQKNPFDLIGLKKDVISFPTFMWKNDIGGQPKIAYNIYKKVKFGWTTMTPTPGKSLLEKVDRAGTGCILIKRKVLEEVTLPFESKATKEGLRFIGEDMIFCDKVHKKGFDVWTHWDYPCSHYKTIDLLAVAQMQVNLINKYTKI